MKKDWTYKRFDEVFDLQMGKTPSRDNPSYWGGDNVWVSIADIQNKYICSSKECITDEAVLESGIKEVPKDTVIMSFKLSVGRSAITTKNLYTNEAIMAFNTKSGFKFMPAFIYYYLQGYKWEGANKAVMGMTLNKKSISSNIFAFPAYEEQQKIVAELDLLCGVIEKQKAQIEELEKLSQSIFYDMFGDPVFNEYNHPIVKLEELCSIITKGTTPTTLGFHFVDEGINFIKVESFNKDESFNLQNVAHITEECHQALKRSILEESDILICIAGATCGRLALVPREALPANTNQAFAIVRLKDKGNLLSYIYSYLHTTYIRKQVDDLKKGVAQPNLTLNHIRNFVILLPPLALQQEFAAKVEAIEAMKAKVRQSLKEAETLFNSRMDYYFN